MGDQHDQIQNKRLRWLLFLILRGYTCERTAVQAYMCTVLTEVHLRQIYYFRGYRVLHYGLGFRKLIINRVSAALWMVFQLQWSLLPFTLYYKLCVIITIMSIAGLDDRSVMRHVLAASPAFTAMILYYACLRTVLLTSYFITAASKMTQRKIKTFSELWSIYKMRTFCVRLKFIKKNLGKNKGWKDI